MRIAYILPVVGAAAALAIAQSDRLAPLPIQLPKPLFEGTPENLKVPQLEKPLGRPRPPFLAPAGTANVALDKTVLYNGPEPVVGEIAMITDGAKTGLDGTYVELAPGAQDIVIDLEAPHTIYAVLVWHYHKQPRVYSDVVVRTAEDPDFLTNVTTLFNNDQDNTSGHGIGKDLHYVETAEGKLIDARGVQARYVRLSSRGNNVNSANHYVEVEVFGRPLK